MSHHIKPSKKLGEVASAHSCKLCNSPGPLHPKSHVIPQWMYKMLPQDGRPMQIASSHHGEHQQKSRTGIWGSYVCPSCEKIFAAWDNYAAKILRQQPTTTAQGWNFGPYEHTQMKFFFLSILWRAHACEHQFVEPVDLNSHAKPLGECLHRKDMKALCEYEVIPTWSSHFLSLGVMTPVRVVIESVTYWQLYLPRFQALIKVDSSPGAPCLQTFAMAEKSSLCMLEKKFNEFGETETVEHVTKKNQKKKNAKRKNP